MDGEGLSEQRHVCAGTAAILAANIFWGFNFVATKFALAETDPLAAALVRIIASTAVALLALRISRTRLSPMLRDWRRFLPLSLSAILFSQILWIYGLAYTTPSHSALMYTLLPVFTAVLAFYLLGERVSARRWLGIGIAFAGAVLLATEGRFDFGAQYLYGDAVTLAAAFAWAVYTVLSKPLVSRYGALPTLAMTFLLGLPLNVPVCLGPAIAQPWTEVSPLGWAGLAYLILVGTFGAYLTFQYSLKHLSAAVVSAFAYLQPVLAALFSMWFLGESITLPLVVSAFLIFAGLLIARKRQRRQAQCARICSA